MALPKRQPDTRPALRLIDTRKIERADWLEVRKTGIGCSDAAAAVGLSPYKSQLELWMEKTNRDADLPKPDPKDTTEPTYWGTMLEPIVAASYTQQIGRKVHTVNAVLQHPQLGAAEAGDRSTTRATDRRDSAWTRCGMGSGTKVRNLHIACTLQDGLAG
ncbi:GP47 (plasmid) [Ralstonia solanacearum Po82]|uniref:YqaJ viral recombinase domain-containing protein n=2 Tax=Ralstonia solanacearum TaxID=305 RepID=A0A5H2PUQ8_RALSL|nr:GP47 [Ralstonia solanacearum Po82]AMP71461.1 hypothetical protein UW163_18235 [Ralstonia solanacearum]EUJ12888.1 hypothetical protein RSP673_18680 [Ralstonia solanacearum P673]AMP75893.1 hypothetical protein RALBFv3_16875 [Ralstonia solanacearum]AYB62582.1 hypothetical protein C2124_18780 [Ralstonia solanacearum]